MRGEQRLPGLDSAHATPPPQSNAMTRGSMPWKSEWGATLGVRNSCRTGTARLSVALEHLLSRRGEYADKINCLIENYPPRD